LRLFWHPLACCGVVSIPRRACQGFLGGIHDQVVLAIFLAHLQRIERDAHILPAEAEKTANAQYHGLDLTILVQEEVTAFADGVIGCVVHILLVVVVHADCIAWHCCHFFCGLSLRGSLLFCFSWWGSFGPSCARGRHLGFLFSF